MYYVCLDISILRFLKHRLFPKSCRDVRTEPTNKGHLCDSVHWRANLFDHEFRPCAGVEPTGREEGRRKEKRNPNNLKSKVTLQFGTR